MADPPEAPSERPAGCHVDAGLPLCLLFLYEPMCAARIPYPSRGGHGGWRNTILLVRRHPYATHVNPPPPPQCRPMLGPGMGGASPSRHIVPSYHDMGEMSHCARHYLRVEMMTAAPPARLGGLSHSAALFFVMQKVACHALLEDGALPSPGLVRARMDLPRSAKM